MSCRHLRHRRRSPFFFYLRSFVVFFISTIRSKNQRIVLVAKSAENYANYNLFLIIVFLMRHQKLNFLSFNAGSKQIEKSGSRSGKESRNLFGIDFNQKSKYS
jgi:hypothetical protein